MIVKTFHRVGSSSFSQQQWRSWIQFCELCSWASVRLGAELVEIMGKKLHHVGIVSKVDRFDLTSQTALTHHLRLTCNPFIAVSPHRKPDNFMESGPCISEQFENDLFSTRDLPARYHGIEDAMDTNSHIGQLLAQIRFPLPGLGIANESRWLSS